MVKIDLHVHSKYSDRPSIWFLQRVGAAESYSEPDYIYRRTVEMGMDYMALTDHNSIKGALILKEKYPDKVIVGVEATSYFPEDGCKIHVLIYDITQKEFDEIEKIRVNIYHLRDYIKQNKLAYSVAHATFSINNKLSGDHLEKLILMFDVFEGINGARIKRSNLEWISFLKELTIEDINRLYKKHKIEPMSDNPWIKGFTGGSDDHAGLFIGHTYTVAQADTLQGVINCLKNKETFAEGRHNNYQGLAFAIYKITIDFIKNKTTGIQKSPLSIISNYIFSDDKKKLSDKIKIKFLKTKGKDEKFNAIKMILQDLVLNIKDIDVNNIDKKLDLIYAKTANICDELLKSLFLSVESDLKNGNITDLVKNIFSTLTGIFISFPFISTFNLLYKSRNLVCDVKATLDKKNNNKGKKVLWFTDTLNDLNGVSETLKTIGRITSERKENLKIITSLLPEEIDYTIPDNVINLQSIYDFKLPLYENIKLKIPSVLNALKLIHEYDPDEIIISTPGPLGLLGVLSTKLLNIKSISVYHTDFANEVSKIFKEEEEVHQITDGYMNWFYSLADEIRIPSYEYFSILERRGHDRSKMKIFKRGIDSSIFKPIAPEENMLLSNYNVNENDFNMIFVGRVSKDKNIDFVFDVYKKLLENNNENIRLFVIGDGPYLEEFKNKCAGFENIIFTGKINNKKLPFYYSMCDALIFPSTTDTFGMVVLEAQSCGTPCLVSDTGGPKEIIDNNNSGFVLPVKDIHPWCSKIEELIKMKNNAMPDYIKLRYNSAINAKNNFNWDNVINELFNHNEETGNKITYDSIIDKLYENKSIAVH